MRPGTLHFLCGKMAAGKTTCARALARTHQAVLLQEDHLLATLFPGEIRSVTDYLTYSRRVRDALAEHIVTLLRSGVTVVLDFPGNTPTQRSWFRQLIDRAQVPHALHYLDVSDDVCKAQLKKRSAGLPPGTPWTTDAEFDAITSYFQAPSTDEGFHVVAERTGDAGAAEA